MIGVYAAALGLSIAVGGCQEYLDHRDTITLGVGDAIAVNKATQTIEHFPEAANSTRWRSDGERARIAVERYRSRTIPNPKATGEQSPAPAPAAAAGGESAAK